MRLRSLRAENFRRFRSVRFDSLPLEGVVGIVGENESGKTTLGEMVSFALFGRSVRLGDDELVELIRWGAESMSVALDLEIDGAHHRVERELDREGSYGARLVDGEGREIARGVGGVRRALEELLPLSFDEFRYSFFLGQKELEAVESDEDDSRRSIFDRMIGVDRVDGIRRDLEAEVDAMEARRGPMEGEASLAAQLADCYESEPGKVERLRAEMARLDEQIEEARAEEGAAEAREAALEEAATEAGRLRLFARWTRLRAGARWLEAALGGLDELRDELRRKVAAERGEWEKLARAAGRYDRFRECLGELERIVSLRGEVVDVELRDELGDGEEPGVSVAGSRREALTVSRRRLADLAEEGRAVRRRFAAWLGAGVLLLAASLTAVFHFGLGRAWAGVVASATLFAGAAWCGSRWREIRSATERLDAHREVLEEEVGRLEGIRRVCAGFALDDPASCEEAVAHMGHPRLSELMERLRSEFEEFWTAEAMKAPFGSCLEATRDNAQKAWETTRRELDELEVRVAGLESRLKVLRGSPFGIEDPAGHALKVSAASLPEFGVALAAEIDAVQKRLGMLEGAGRDPEGLRLAEEPGECRRRCASLGEDVDASAVDWDAAARAFDGVTVDAPWLERADRVEAELLALAGDEAAWSARRRDAAKAAAAARRRRGEIEAERRSRAEACGHLEPGVAKGVELRERAEKADAALEVLRRDLALRRILVESFDDLASRMRKRFAPAVASHVGRILPSLTRGRYERIEMDEAMTPRVFSTERGEFVPMHVLSGGTVDQILLSLRLAFSESLMRTKLGAGRVQMLFLDEPLMSFDDERCKGFLELMRREHEHFAQVFVVSHRTGLRERFDQVVETSLDRDAIG